MQCKRVSIDWKTSNIKHYRFSNTFELFIFNDLMETSSILLKYHRVYEFVNCIKTLKQTRIVNKTVPKHSQSYTTKKVTNGIHIMI